MRKIFIGEVIRRRRRELGISQEELCEGICSVSTLSRLERGCQAPSQVVVNALCQKLSLPFDDLPVILGPKDLQVEALRREIISLNCHFEGSIEDERTNLRQESYAKIHAMEQVIAKDDRVSRQLILRSRVLLGRENGMPYTLEEQLSLLLEALRVTTPGLDLENMESWRLTLDEVKIINQIALRHSRAGQREEALDLYAKLLTYLQGQVGNSEELARQICLVASNYARELRLNEQFSEALKIAILGREACQRYGHFTFLGPLTHTLAECYHFLGDKKQSVSLFFQAYNFCQFTGDKKSVALLQADAQKYFPELSAIAEAFSGFFG